MTSWRLQAFVEGNAEPTAKVYSDESVLYKGVARHHEAVMHSAREYARGDVSTNGLESFWGLFKRGYHGTFHHMSPKLLQRYGNEFAGRHNVRPLDTIDQIRALVRGMEGKRLRYRELVA